MCTKVDRVVQSIESRFSEYNRAVDNVTTRAHDHLRQLERESHTTETRITTLDPLTRDIELLRARREHSVRAEAILSQVKVDVQRERLDERFNFVRQILNLKTPIYDQRGAAIAYKSLVNDLGALLRTKPGLANLEIVKDPLVVNVNKPYLNPPQNPNTSLFPPQANTGNNTTLPLNTSIPPLPSPHTHIPRPTADALGSILHQNYSAVDHSVFSNPKLKLDKILFTSHKGPITAVLSLNPRYLATAAADRTLCLWDLHANMTLLFASPPMDAEVTLLRKLTVDPNHFIGHMVIAAKQCKSAANIGAFNFASVPDLSSPAKLLWSNSIADKVTAIEILSGDRLLAAYEGGLLCALDIDTLEIIYRADIKAKIESLLVLPDAQTVIVTTDNEFTILDFPRSLQVTTRKKRRDTAAFASLRCVGRNSEVFAGFLKNGLVKIYRATDGECLNVILGQRAQYESSFILNFFATDPNIFVLALSRFKPHFFYSNIDDSEMKALESEEARFTVARGDPVMQIVDLTPGTSMAFTTVANQEGKPPGLYLWKLSFSS